MINYNNILLAGTARSVFSPISIFNSWSSSNQWVTKIVILGNVFGPHIPNNLIGNLATRAIKIGSFYPFIPALHSICFGPTYGLGAQLPKIIALIKDRFPTPVQIPVNPVPNPPIVPTDHSDPIVNPFPTTSGLNDAPPILATRYSGPIVNPFPTICGLDEQPISAPPLPQSSVLLPIIGVVAAAALLGYVAYRWYQQGPTIEPIQKIPEPVVPIKEEPIKIEPELNEIQLAAASFTDTNRYFVTRYSISAARFTKAALINLIRSIKYIVLSILFLPALVTQSGRLNFKSNCAQILPSLRQTFISLAGIPCPPLALRLL